MERGILCAALVCAAVGCAEDREEWLELSGTNATRTASSTLAVEWVAGADVEADAARCVVLTLDGSGDFVSAEAGVDEGSGAQWEAVRNTPLLLQLRDARGDGAVLGSLYEGACDSRDRRLVDQDLLSFDELGAPQDEGSANETDDESGAEGSAEGDE